MPDAELALMAAAAMSTADTMATTQARIDAFPALGTYACACPCCGIWRWPSHVAIDFCGCCLRAITLRCPKTGRTWSVTPEGVHL